jgi:cytoskeleton protein RodZ
MKAELPPKGEIAAKATPPPKVPPKILEEEKKPAGLSAPVVMPPSGEEKKAEAGPHVLTIKASAVTWMRIRTGEPPDIDVILRPNETVTYKTKRSFNVEVGNAGGVELIFDGRPVGPLGKSGEVVHLILPPQSSAPKEITSKP